MKVKNEQIGEVPCPIRGCDKTCAVYRFRARTEGRARFAGKLYCACTVHGRYGTDGSPASQEYILSEGKIWGDKKTESTGDPALPVPATPAPAAAKPAAPTPAKTPKAPEPAPETKPRSPWRPLID